MGKSNPAHPSTRQISQFDSVLYCQEQAKLKKREAEKAAKLEEEAAKAIAEANEGKKKK